MIQHNGVEVHKGYVKFAFEKDSKKLRPNPDMVSWDQHGGKVTVPLMNFFCHWFQTSSASHILVCPSELAILLRALLNRTTSFPSLMEFFEDHLGSESRPWNTLMIPICDYEHQSSAILSDEGFLKFDSGFVKKNNFHAPQKLHEALGKLWCIGTGKTKDTSAWKLASDINS